MSQSSDQKAILAAVAGVAVGAAAFAYCRDHKVAKKLEVQNARSHQTGVFGRWNKPIVIASPALEPLARALRKRLGAPEYPDQGETIYLDRFSSGDFNGKFNWSRVAGRKVVMLFDTIDQSRLLEQLSLLQALQGFAVPDSEDKGTKWKTYVGSGKYSWGRAASITVVLPWYRPCQMERTSRWQLDVATGKWTNGDPEGEWLDVPTALYYARLLSTPGSVPPLPGPTDALDGMPLTPLWRPPLELLFVELHEEVPVSQAVSDLDATIRMERYVPYFLDKFKSKRDYAGKAHFYVLFPDHGAWLRYQQGVFDVLKLDSDHVLYIEKSRVGEKIEQVQTLFYDLPDGTKGGTKEEFSPEDQVLIVDDFTNSGKTLTGAVDLIKSKTKGEGTCRVSIFVAHLLASYKEEVVLNLKKAIHDLGPSCKLFVTNSIPMTTDLLKDDPQIEVCDLSDFIADLLQAKR